MKEMLSAKQTIAIIALFCFGTSVVVGTGFDAHQDSWISLIIAVIFSVPLFIIYARIIKLYPGKSLFDIIEILFNKIIGKILIAMLIWYFVFLGGLVLHNFYEFISITSLPKTPKIMIMILMILVVIYLGRSNISVFGKWGIVIFILIFFLIFMTFVFSLGNIDVKNLLPIFEHSPMTILRGSIKIFVFPFAEVIAILPLACFLKKGTNSYKVFIGSLIISGVILLLISFRNLLTIGSPIMEYSFFPSYTAARIIEVGDFLNRIEGAVAINFLFAVLTKLTVCLIAATKGVCKLFNLDNYKKFILPVGLIILTIGVIVYSSIFEMEEFKEEYVVIYSIPFQLVIPILIWITAEIKNKKNKVNN